jgi:hypothetical protein
MKTNLNVLLAIVLILSLTSSCEKDVVNIKHPEFYSKLVISGYLSPDEKNHYISVTTNGPIYYDRIPDYNQGLFSATLSDGSKEISLRPRFHNFYKYAVNDSTTFLSDIPTSSFNIPGVPDSSIIGFFFTSSELPVEEGLTYVLKVESDKGLFAEASCTVPLKKNLFPELDTISIHYTNSYNNTKYTYLQPDFYFTDIKEEENYYGVFSELTWPNPPYTYSKTQNKILVDAKYNCFNDKGIDGDRLKIPLESFYNTYIGLHDSTYFKIYLLNTDKPYYDYHKSIEKYQSGEIPFTEASPIYSNVKGGLGIFAAYTYDSIVIRLK